MRLSVLVLLALLAGCQGAEPAARLPASLAGRTIDVTGLPALEQPGARLAIVEVTDYQCPFCRAHFLETLPALRRELVASGRVGYFVQDYPLPGQPLSALAARAASCAGRQGQFWPFHDGLFRLALPLQEEAIMALGATLALDVVELADCIERHSAASWVERQQGLAVGLGVRGTPTFLVGRLQENRVVSDITVLAGRQTLQDFMAVLDAYPID